MRTEQRADRTARPHLSDRAAEYLRAAIMAGDLEPGRTVRPEWLGAELGISATPAREGMQKLAVEGFLTAIPGAGFVVSELTPDDIRDLFLVQALIAGELAARAAASDDDADRDELRAIHHELIAAAARHDVGLLEERNHAFHRHLHRMGGSPKLAWALGLMTRYVPRRFYATIDGWPEATVNDHRRILEAVLAHDAAEARSAAHEHIRHAGELLAEHFGRITRGGPARRVEGETP